jgi:hypothetical protein
MFHWQYSFCSAYKNWAKKGGITLHGHTDFGVENTPLQSKFRSPSENRKVLVQLRRSSPPPPVRSCTTYRIPLYASVVQVDWRDWVDDFSEQEPRGKRGRHLGERSRFRRRSGFRANRGLVQVTFPRAASRWAVDFHAPVRSVDGAQRGRIRVVPRLQQLGEASTRSTRDRLQSPIGQKEDALVADPPDLHYRGIGCVKIHHQVASWPYYEMGWRASGMGAPRASGNEILMAMPPQPCG